MLFQNVKKFFQLYEQSISYNKLIYSITSFPFSDFPLPPNKQTTGARWYGDVAEVNLKETLGSFVPR